MNNGPMPDEAGLWWNLNLTFRGPGRQCPVENFFGDKPAIISKRHLATSGERQSPQHRLRPIDDLPSACRVGGDLTRRQELRMRYVLAVEVRPRRLITHQGYKTRTELPPSDTAWKGQQELLGVVAKRASYTHNEQRQRAWV